MHSLIVANEEVATVDDETPSPAELARETDIKVPSRHLGLAMRSEALFSRGSPLNLPASVFAGATVPVGGILDHPVIVRSSSSKP